MVDYSHIVRVRGRRLDHARRNLARTKSAFTEAGRRLVDAQHDVASFLEETQTLEIGLLKDVLDRPVTINDLLAIDEKLRKVKTHAQKLADAVVVARQALKATGDAFEAAAVEKTATEAHLNKSGELHARHRQIEKLKLIAAEDAELDEFTELIAIMGHER